MNEIRTVKKNTAIVLRSSSLDVFSTTVLIDKETNVANGTETLQESQLVEG